MTGVVPFPAIMGIVNITPDSFSDGGNYLNVDAAVEHALQLINDGADYLDIGGESTRPGAEAVIADDELLRVIPVIEGIRKANSSIPISIDTSKSIVADEALRAGASLINDVTAGLADPEIISIAAKNNVPIILMHMQGTPRTMQNDPKYTDVVDEVEQFLSQRVQAVFERNSIATVYVDPGIGFGKTLQHNIDLLHAIDRFNNIAPVVVGISRKKFLGIITGLENAAERDNATMLLHALLLSQPIAIARVHNVAMMKQLKEISLAV